MIERLPGDSCCPEPSPEQQNLHQGVPETEMQWGAGGTALLQAEQGLGSAAWAALQAPGGGVFLLDVLPALPVL